MFRSILLDPKYRSLQLILWRNSTDENIKCIELNTVSFGFKSSTFLATRCLIELADRYKIEYPAASSILYNNTYCDDILVAGDSINELLESKRQLLGILELGGFGANKWFSNSDIILGDIPTNVHHFDDIDMQKQNYYLKTLGVTYNTNTDEFKISSLKPKDKKPFTKRDIISFVARFYDPLGLAGPLLVCAKALIQKIWLAQKRLGF